MDSKKDEDTSKAEVTIKTEDTQEEGVITQADTSPPTLEKMLADPIAFRRYVSHLADTTPRAPPDLYGDAFKNWEYRHLLTATLYHLLDVFKNHDDPQQHAWLFYQAWLIVNNTDYKESPFISFTSAKNLFAHEASGRRKCARVARGLPETEERGSKKRKRGEEEEGSGGKGKGKGRSMLG